MLDAVIGAAGDRIHLDNLFWEVVFDLAIMDVMGEDEFSLLDMA